MNYFTWLTNIREKLYRGRVLDEMEGTDAVRM